MKLRFTRLLALTLALLMLLGMTSVAEDALSMDDSVIIDNSVNIDDDMLLDDLPTDEDILLSDVNFDDIQLDLEAQSTDGLELEIEDSAEAEQDSEDNANAIQLGVAETYKINTKKLGKNLTFKSSKPKIASVTEKGIVTGVKKGTAVITVMSNKKVKAKYTFKVMAAPAKVTLPQKAVTIGVKESVNMPPTIPSGSHTTFTWAVKNNAIATVTTAGKITGKKAGTTNITVKTHNGKKATVKVTVKAAPKKVTLNKTKLTMAPYDEFKLKATLPTGSASHNLTWTSSDESVVSVFDDGWLFAEGVGTATITVKTYNGKKATCKVTVEEEEPEPTPTSIELDNNDVLLLAGTGFYLHATVYPENVETELTWSSSNGSKISVDQDGYVHADGYGKAVITVTTDNGLSATCAVESTDMEVGIFIDEPISKVIDRMPISLIHDQNIYHSAAYDVAFVVNDNNIVTAVSIQPSNPVGRFEIFGIWAEMDDDDCEDILDDLGFSYIGKTSSGMYVYELGSYRIGIAYDDNYCVKQCMLTRYS